MGARKDKSFGELILELRQKKKWTVKELISRLEIAGDRKISPAYITRVEQYGEIPSPELICLMADVFDYNLDKLLECALKLKKRRLDEALKEKYQKAVGHYRKQKGTE